MRTEVNYTEEVEDPVDSDGTWRVSSQQVHHLVGKGARKRQNRGRNLEASCS